MERFSFITLDAKEDNKTYLACIPICHIASITSVPHAADGEHHDKPNAINLVNGQQIWVEMTYAEILQSIKKSVSFPIGKQ